MNQKKILEAIEFAVLAHAGQCRKGTKIPYVTHPLRVAKILTEEGCTEPLIIAGILHDTLEDTATTFSEIKKKFGKNVATLVQHLSEHDTTDTWENRKKHTLQHLKSAPPPVVMIACADKLDNIRNIRKDYEVMGEELWKRFNRSKEKQKWYFTSLAKVFETRKKNLPKNSIIFEFQSEVTRVFKKS